MQHRIGTAGLWLLNAVLLIALIALAGTSLSQGSAVALVAVGAVVFGGAAIALFGRDLVLSAELEFAAFVAVLAYSGIRLGALAAPGGAAIGSVTAGVLGSFVVIALLLAALAALVALRRVPVWLRAVLACIAVYALTPVAFELLRGEGLDAALATNAPLPSDPFWIRGAFVCAAVLLPGATLASFALAVLLMMRKQRQAASRLGAGTLAFLFATQMIGLQAAQTGLPGTFAFRPAGTSASIASSAGNADFAAGFAVPSGPTVAGAASVSLASSESGPSSQGDAPSVDQLATSMRRVDYEVDARADALGAGVEPAFDFVRDHVRFESYSGVFRGASGTFTAHAGNAWDRSVLLGTMLARKGIAVRYVTGRLSGADAERLFARIFEGTVTHSASRHVPAGAGAFAHRVYARAARDYAVMRAALGGVANATDPSPSHAQLIAEIEDHAWLQAQVNGSWQDLDPSFPDAVPGKAYATAAETYDAVPDAVMRHVTIRVQSETLAEGTLATTTALELTMPASDLLDKQIFLQHVATGTGSIADDRNSLTPVLNVAGVTHAGTPIAFAPPASTAGQMSSAIGGINAGDGSATSAPAATGPAFVAEWLECEIDTPDGHKDTTRRTLFDRAGAAWRASATHDPVTLRPLPRNKDGFLNTQAVYNIWFSGGDHNNAAYAAGLALLAHAHDDGSPVSPPSTFEEAVWPLAMRDFGWLVMSDHVIVPSLNDSTRVHFYADTPRIFIFGFGPDPAGTNATTIESDLRRDDLRGVARDASDATAVLEHKMWFGALEGALEHEFGATEAATAGGHWSFASTSGLLTPEGAVVIRPGDTSAPVAAAPESAARIATALANGDTLVVPRQVLRGGPAGWWQIAHASGDTRAVFGPDVNSSYSLGSGPIPINRGNIGSLGKAPVWDLTKSNAQNLAANSCCPKPAAQKPGSANEYVTIVMMELSTTPAWQTLSAAIILAMSAILVVIAATMTVTPDYP